MSRFVKLNGWNQQDPQPGNYLTEGSTYYINIDHIESVHEMGYQEDEELGHKKGDFAQTIVHVAAPPVTNGSAVLHNWYTTTEERATAFMERVNAILNADKAVCDIEPEKDKKAE